MAWDLSFMAIPAFRYNLPACRQAGLFLFVILSLSKGPKEKGFSLQSGLKDKSFEYLPTFGFSLVIAVQKL
jgi:hypothetical protein